MTKVESTNRLDGLRVLKQNEQAIHLIRYHMFNLAMYIFVKYCVHKYLLQTIYNKYAKVNQNLYLFISTILFISPLKLNLGSLLLCSPSHFSAGAILSLKEIKIELT